MKSIIILIILIISLSIYILVNHNNNEIFQINPYTLTGVTVVATGFARDTNHSFTGLQQRHSGVGVNIKNYQIVVEEVSGVVTKIPAVKEIDYFETTKDIDNWFVRSDEKKGIETKRSQKYVSQGNYSMQINWKPKEWAELIFVHFSQDWNNYNYFSLDIFNPDNEDISFQLRIGDRFDASGFYPKANKFVMKNVLKPGWNTLNLKISDIVNKINILSERKVIHLRFFTKDKTLYLDNMRIEI